MLFHCVYTCFHFLEIGVAEHYKVCRYLKEMENEQIRELGEALGLAYAKLRRMHDLPAEMVAAWLRKEDNVQNPSWNTLFDALMSIGQTGIANKIKLNDLESSSHTESVNVEIPPAGHSRWQCRIV